MPDDVRPPIRTFTIRELRPAELELDVDFVLHGDTGPASTWAGRASPATGSRSSGRTRGTRRSSATSTIQAAADTDWTLLAGDETALPAITAILARCRPAAARWCSSRSSRRGDAAAGLRRPTCA